MYLLEAFACVTFFLTELLLYFYKYKGVILRKCVDKTYDKIIGTLG